MELRLFERQLALPRMAMIVLLGAGAASGQLYQETKLVLNASGGTATTDARLVNPWGLSRSSTSPWWVADNGTGMSTLYNATGVAQSIVVSVPGAPTGTVYNGTTDFELAPGKPARFIFSSEDGTISGWNSSVDATHAIVMATTPGAVYKGLAIAVVNGKRQLYATDFHGRHIDVFNSSFQKVGELDPTFHSIWRGRSDDDFSGLESAGFLGGLSPFGIQNIGGNLFVTFAKQDADGEDDVAGPGNGAVAVYTPAGQPVRVFEHVDGLNSPWGLALAPGDFGAFSHYLLVGQFGSGEILAFNMETGKMAGKMMDAAGQPLKIDGLWAIAFGSGGNSGPLNTMYFTAGPDDEQNGLFGTLTAVTSQLIDGNGN